VIAIVIEAIVGETTTTLRWRSRCQADDDGDHDGASILRNIHSVEDSLWSALTLRDCQFYESPVYQLHVYEGVASGDAFGAGLLHGFLHGFDGQKQVNYAIAASVLKLTVSGDLNLVSEAEISGLMDSGASAMNR